MSFRMISLAPGVGVSSQAAIWYPSLASVILTEMEDKTKINGWRIERDKLAVNSRRVHQSCSTNLPWGLLS